MICVADGQDQWLGYRDDKGKPSNPNPKQVEAEQIFFDPEVDHLLLEGGQNSGKTICAVKVGLIDAMVRYPGLSVGIGHMRYRSLERSLIDKIRFLLDRTVKLTDGSWHKILEYAPSKHRIVIRIPDDRLLHPQYGYTAHIDCIALDPKKTLDDILKTEGSQYGSFLWDQCESERSRGRSVHSAIASRTRLAPAKTLYTANPEIDVWYDELFHSEGNPLYHRFRSLLMNPEDNEYRGDRYLDRMRSSWTDQEWKRYAEGLAVAAGARVLDYNWEFGFDTWDRIPDGYEVWGIMDFGQVDPTVWQLWAVAPNGHVYLFASLKILGKDAEIRYVAKAVREFTHYWLTKGRKSDEQLPMFRVPYGDPSMFGRKDVRDRKSIADQFAEEGLRMRPAPIIGRNSGGQVKHEIALIISLHTEGKLHVCRDQKDWLNEERIWIWNRSGKEEPADWRSMSSNEVLHHFDHMACMRYFATSFKENIGGGDYEDMSRRHVQHDDYDNDYDINRRLRIKGDSDVEYFSKLIYGR